MGMKMLFSYGTLQLARVQLDLFGRELTCIPDALVGYKVSNVKIKDKAVIAKSGTDIHPIIIHSGDELDIVEGSVLKLSKAELLIADSYEVKDYQRVSAMTRAGVKVWIYTKS